MRRAEESRSASSLLISKRSFLPKAASSAVCSLLLTIAAPALSWTGNAGIAAAPSEEELRSSLFGAIERGRAGDCAGLLDRLDPLVPRLAPGSSRVEVQKLRLPCLAAVGRQHDLDSAQRELAAAAPSDGLVRSFGIAIAADQGRYREAAEQLALLAEDDPASLSLISGSSWRGIAQKLNEQAQFALRDRVFVALARADWQPRDRPEMRDGLAQGAIEALLGRKEINEAREYLARIEMPELLYAMAIERLYQPLWPHIEARLGPQAGKAVDHFAAARLEEFARTPDDPHAMREAIRAFILLGRYGDAAELGERVAVRDGMGEDEVVAVRYHAQALAAQGQRDRAVQRMAGFAALDLDRTPDAASAMVSFAELLDENGESARALAVSRDTLKRGGNVLSGWGKAWLRRTETCALGALGRPGEARLAGDALKAAAADNEAAAIEGLLCLGRKDEAAALATRAFSTSEGASQIADQFQPDGAIWAPSESRLRKLWSEFLKRPDIKAAFDRRARILPAALWPSRQPRAIPRQSNVEPGPLA